MHQTKLFDGPSGLDRLLVDQTFRASCGQATFVYGGWWCDELSIVNDESFERYQGRNFGVNAFSLHFILALAKALNRPPPI